MVDPPCQFGRFHHRLGLYRFQSGGIQILNLHPSVLRLFTCLIVDLCLGATRLYLFGKDMGLQPLIILWSVAAPDAEQCFKHTAEVTQSMSSNPFVVCIFPVAINHLGIAWRTTAKVQVSWIVTVLAMLSTGTVGGHGIRCNVLSMESVLLCLPYTPGRSLQVVSGFTPLNGHPVIQRC